MLLQSIFQVIDLLLQVITYLIIAQAILSWLLAFNVLNVHSGGVRNIVVALDRLTAPLYRPIRKIMPDFGGLDFSPLVVLLLIAVVRILLNGLQVQLIYGG